MKFGIGQPVRRKEDTRFISGNGRYVSDITVARQTRAVFVYSPHAHADIRGIDTTAAQAVPGVVAVLTGADYVADGMGALSGVMPEDMGGPPGRRTAHMPLATDRVRFVGERVAVIIAETELQARDAAELVEIDFAPLPAVVEAADSVRDGAPLVYDDAPNNISFTLRLGDADATEAAFARAHHVTRLKLHNNRLDALAMESRGCLGEYDPSTDRVTLTTSTQNVHGIREGLANQVLKVSPASIRVIARDVGGGFGMKTMIYPEEAVVAWACRRIGRPVKWIGTRAETLQGDAHGRDQSVDAELALDKDGRFIGLRWRAWHNVGAYVDGAGMVPPLFSVKLASTVYDLPAVDVTTSAVFTNTSPTTPYRGAGRPEAVYIMERLVDAAARETGMDRTEIRRINFIAPGAMPYANHTGWVYDCGEYAATLEKCRGLADIDGYDDRRSATEARGLRRGLGIVYYVDNTGNFNDRMEIRFDQSGGATILSGLVSQGQGHETAFPQMVSDWLGIPIESIRLTQADTDEIAIGRGTYASRSMMVGGSALRAAADEVIEKGKKFTAHFLEASAGDIEFAKGRFTVAGTDKSMSMTEVAQRSFAPVMIPSELGIGLQGAGAFAAEVPSFPNGCHIAEVEVDPDTGVVRIDRYTVVDDIGTVINPLLAQGQIHGGIAQGVGQALLEDMRYDPESGQLVTGSLMDYAVPRADTLPSFSIDFNPVPSMSNPLGVKGVGEGGTVAGTPTIVNAVLDAISEYGVTAIDTPLTPERVWKAINGGA